MAYVRIDPITNQASLKKLLDYVGRDDKTNDKFYTDSYECTFDEHTLGQWERVRKHEVIQKGNNLAWQIKQCFAPTDQVTPEMALEIGQKLMARVYPTHQYVIATHTDREHIHNHIVINSVNFVDFHKLVSNPKTLRELRKTSDELCKEYGLSVIERQTKKEILKKDIDAAIEISNDFNDFVATMQEKGYLVKKGEHLSFKNDEMGKFVRSSSISIDYTENMIRSRLETKHPAVYSKRTVFDDKLKYTSKRQRLKAEIDAAIRKSNSFSDFLSDLSDRGYVIKLGKHIAFKEMGENENGKKPRFMRGDSISFHYTEQAIKWRIENKELYAAMMSENAKLQKVIDYEHMDGGLYNWAAGENANRLNASSNWIKEHILDDDNDFPYTIYTSGKIRFAFFMMKYNGKKAEITSMQKNINDLNSEISKLSKIKKAVEEYWIYKPVIEKYQGVNEEELSEQELSAYKTAKGKWYNINYAFEQAKSNNQSLKTSEINEQIKELKAEINSVGNELIQSLLEFESYETVKYNYETSHNNGGFGITPEEAEKALKKALADTKVAEEKEAKKAARKEKIKRFFIK